MTRYLSALDTAVLKPTLAFDGEDLYPTLAAKAAALLHALVTTTPFVTASRGTAAVAAECFLAANGVALAATDQEIVQLAMSAERGEWGIESITVWIAQRLQRR
jgi:death on curing protein